MSLTNLPTVEVERYTWTNRPNVASYAGEIIYISDVGTYGSHWVSNGTIWSPVGGEVTLKQSGSPIALTGTASETVAVTYIVPAGMFSSTGQIDVIFLARYTNNANTKTFRVKYGSLGSGTAGTSYYSAAPTTTATLQAHCSIKADGATNSQKGWGTGSTIPGGYGNIALSIRTTSVNTLINTEVNMTMQLGSAADTMTILGYSIVYRG